HMSTQAKSRRRFLIESISGVGGSWVTANYAAILATEEYVVEAAQAGQPVKFAFFTPEQAAEVEAMTAQIIPSDSTPGALEARVIQFIDRALVTFEKDRQGAYTQGLKELQAKTSDLFPSARAFSQLTSEQQIKVLTAIEQTPFFNLVRTHT